MCGQVGLSVGKFFLMWAFFGYSASGTGEKWIRPCFSFNWIFVIIRKWLITHSICSQQMALWVTAWHHHFLLLRHEVVAWRGTPDGVVWLRGSTEDQVIKSSHLLKQEEKLGASWTAVPIEMAAGKANDKKKKRGQVQFHSLTEARGEIGSFL